MSDLEAELEAIEHAAMDKIADRALTLIGQQLVARITHLPVDEQILAVRAALRDSPIMLTSPGLAEWIHTNKDRIVEMAKNGELSGK